MADRGDHHRLEIDLEANPREALVGAMASILGYADEQIERASQEPVRAVHEFRKSLRRARALLRLCRPLLGEKDFRKLRDPLRGAFRATGPLRDADVMRDALALLPATDLPEGLDREALIAELSGRPGDDEAGQQQPDAAATLLEHRTALALVPDALRSALPKKLKITSLRRGLRDTYGACCEARLRSAMERSDEAIHDWRKRVKEVRYQLEAIGGGLDDHPASGPRTALSSLATNLGEVTDLILLRQRLAQGVEGLSEEDRDALATAALGEQARRYNRAYVDAVPLFLDDPRTFARAMIKKPAALPTS